MLSDIWHDVLTEVFQGVVATILVSTLAAIAVIDVLNNRPVNEPPILAGLAGAVVGYYFAGRLSRGQQRTINSLADHIVNGGKQQ